MRHWLPLCAMIVIVSGCVASRPYYDGPALPTLEDARAEARTDDAPAGGTIPAFPQEDRPASTETPVVPDAPSAKDSQSPKPGEPFVTLKTFTDGGKFVGARAYTIEWECCGFGGGGAEIFVEFYDGRGWRCLWRGEPAETKFNWRLPNIDSVYCKIRVRAVDGPVSRTAASEAFFIIERGATERSMSIEIDDEQPSDDVVVVEPTVKQFAPDGKADDAEPPKEPAETESTEAEPARMDALLLQGNDLLSRGEYSNAETAFLECLKNDPAKVEALYGLGQARYRAGHLAEAREALLRVTALHDDHADAHYCLGRIAMKLAETAADPAAERANAKRFFLRVVLIDPKYSEAYNDLGKVFFDGGEVEDAYRNFRRAVDCDGGDKIFLYNAGRAAYALGRREECVDYCKRALAVDAKFRYPCWLAAKCCSELARWSEAVTYWAAAAEMFASDEKLRAEALDEGRKAREALAKDME